MIYYCLVASSNKKVVFDCAIDQERKSQKKICRRVLKKLTPQEFAEESKIQYTGQDFLVLAYYTGENYILCVSSKVKGNFLLFKFLEKLESFYSSIIDRQELTQEVLRAMQEEEQDDIDFEQVKGKIKDVKNIMTKNVDAILKRGQNLEEIANKADELADTSQDFRVSAKKLKNKMWWRNVKLTALLIVIILVVVFVVVFIACGICCPPFHRCIDYFTPDK